MKNELAILMLATFDGWSAAQWAFNIIITIAFSYHKRQAGRIDQLMEELKKSNKAAIDAELKGMRERIDAHINPVMDKIDEIKQRLDGGDETFEKLGDRDHKIELKFNEKLDELKDWMRQNTASKDDSKQHAERAYRRHEQLSETVRKLGEAVASLSGERAKK